MTSVVIAVWAAVTSLAFVGLLYIMYSAGVLEGRKNFQTEYAKELERVRPLLENIGEESKADREMRKRLLEGARRIAEASVKGNIATRDQILVIVSALGGLIGLGVMLWQTYKNLSTESIIGNFRLVSEAFAAEEPPRADLAWMFPWIVAGLLTVIAIAFLGAIVTLLISKDIPDNQSKLKAASDIVKMFGGFFTGIATTLLN